MPVAAISAGTMRKPPPMPKKPARVPVAPPDSASRQPGSMFAAVPSITGRAPRRTMKAAAIIRARAKRISKYRPAIALPIVDPIQAPATPVAENNAAVVRRIWPRQSVHAESESGSEHINITNSTLLSRGTKISIAPGHNLNIKCDILSQTANFLHASQRFHFIDATIEISAEYEISILGLYKWTRNPVATKFTWVTDVSNPQWVRGEFVP